MGRGGAAKTEIPTVYVEASPYSKFRIPKSPRLSSLIFLARFDSCDRAARSFQAFQPSIQGWIWAFCCVDIPFLDVDAKSSH
jgi:hypothetical protein